MKSWPRHWQPDCGSPLAGACLDSPGTKIATTTNTQQTGPWAPQQQYLTDIFAKAQNLYNTGQPQYYPGSTVSPTTPNTQQSWSDIVNLANSGSPLLGAANAGALNTINGDYLNAGNPYLSALTQSNLDHVQPSVAGQFERSGRFGSNAYSSADSYALANALAPQVFGNYQNERGLQQQATNLAPSLNQANYLAPSMLQQVGSAQQAQGQAQLSDLVNQFNFNQNEPANWLQQYLALVTGNYGKDVVTTDQTAFQTPSLFQQVLNGVSTVSNAAQKVAAAGV